MKKIPRKQLGYFIGAILYIVINALLFRMEYANYNEKIIILCEVVDAEKSGEEIFSVVTELLKGARTEPESNKLLEYGYLREHLSAQKKRLYGHWTLILTLTTLTAAAAVLWRGRERQLLREEETERLEQINTQINQLRDGNYQMLTGLPNAEEAEGKSQEVAMMRLRMDFASLAEQLELVIGTARREKEETKTLVTNLSHQLKTPVAALKASLEILNNPGLTSAEREEFTERCIGQIVRLEELINALMQISRMETGVIEVHLEEKSLLDTIRIAVNRIYVKAQEKNIDISMEVRKEDEELQVMQDSKWLSEALINLLENAIKYSDNNTHIRIRLERRTIFWRLEIEDEGIGVPRKERSQIFKRFYRGEENRIRKESGSGIGLYLTRMIIEKHGGTITVRSPKQNERRGSIFVIQLPSLTKL